MDLKQKSGANCNIIAILHTKMRIVNFDFMITADSVVMAKCFELGVNHKSIWW